MTVGAVTGAELRALAAIKRGKVTSYPRRRGGVYRGERFTGPLTVRPRAVRSVVDRGLAYLATRQHGVVGVIALTADGETVLARLERNQRAAG